MFQRSAIENEVKLLVPRSGKRLVEIVDQGRALVTRGIQAVNGCRPEETEPGVNVGILEHVTNRRLAEAPPHPSRQLLAVLSSDIEVLPTDGHHAPKGHSLLAHGPSNQPRVIDQDPHRAIIIQRPLTTRDGSRLLRRLSWISRAKHRHWTAVGGHRSCLSVGFPRGTLITLIPEMKAVPR